MPELPLRKSNRLIWFGIVGVTLVLSALSFIGYEFVAPRGQGKSLDFTILSGETVKQVSLHLEQAHLIRSRFWFESWVWLTSTESKFVAGDYQISLPTNTVRLVRLLTVGAKPSNELNVRFIEGWTLKQMGEHLEAQGIVSSKLFVSLTTNPEQFNNLFASTGVSALQPGFTPTTLEGYLFPDTYRHYRNVGATDLVEKMLLNFKQKFSPEWIAELKRSNRTPYQALIMASIVEREVPEDADRAKVADLFWRRLSVGQGLEADSTINYVTGKGDPAVGATDLKVNSPYNTYRHRGLPPGPISNPGVSALKATVYPEPNPYWYFLTTPQGQVIYSKTFADHVKAKQQYLR